MSNESARRGSATSGNSAQQGPQDAGEADKAGGIPPRRMWLLFLAILLANFLPVRLFLPE